MTVCQWVDGQYEDQVFQGDQRLISAIRASATDRSIAPDFALTPDQIFIPQ